MAIQQIQEPKIMINKFKTFLNKDSSNQLYKVLKMLNMEVKVTSNNYWRMQWRNYKNNNPQNLLTANMVVTQTNKQHYQLPKLVVKTFLEIKINRLALTHIRIGNIHKDNRVLDYKAKKDSLWNKINHQYYNKNQPL